MYVRQLRDVKIKPMIVRLYTPQNAANFALHRMGRWRVRMRARATQR